MNEVPGDRGARKRSARAPIVGILVSSLFLAACEPEAPPAEVVRVVRTQKVVMSDDQTVMELAAEVRARTEITLAFRVGGKLIAREVDVGQVVEPGRVLARLDPSDLRSGLAAATAQLQAAAVQRSQAQADRKRFRRLRQQGFISDAELDSRESAFKSADAQYRQARAQQQLQANQESYAQLSASTQGIVVAVEAEVGAVLTAGMPVVRIARNGERDAVFAVPEDRRDWVLSLKDSATSLPVLLWGNDQPISAKIREVAAAADAASRTYLVRASLEQTNLAPGQTATVRLPLPGRKGALVPSMAIFERDGQAHVWLVDGDPLAVRAVSVSVEPAGSETLLITSGLPVDAIIATAGVHVLQDGQAVRLSASAAQ